jgi:hypothetical protein
MCIQLNKKHNVLVDHIAIMLSPEAIDELKVGLEQHELHTDTELELIGRKTVEENHPSMVKQFDFDCFRRQK